MGLRDFAIVKPQAPEPPPLAPQVNIDLAAIVKALAALRPQGPCAYTFTVHRDDYPRVVELLQAVAASHPGVAISGDDRVAKLAVVGSGMRSHAGVAARLFETLAQEEINVRLVSTSEIKIAVLLAEDDIERAVRALHGAYGLAGN